MGVVTDYIATVPEAKRAVLAHMFEVVRQQVPDAKEIVSYGMPAFAYNGKAFLAIIANKRFLSLYPFCNLASLDLDISGFETTKASIHFSAAKPLPDDLLRTIVLRRIAM